MGEKEKNFKFRNLSAFEWRKRTKGCSNIMQAPREGVTIIFADKGQTYFFKLNYCS